MKKLIAIIAVAAITFVSPLSFGRGGSSFGGSRSSGSSFGGSRSSGSSSSFGGSRSGSVASRSSGSSSFGGSRSTARAPIVRPSSPSSGSSGSTSSHTNVYVNHNYGGGYGYGGYYGSPYYGGGFMHGFMWGQFFNRPQVIYVGGQQYVAGPNGQPMMDGQGQPIVYQSNPAMTALAVLIWLVIIGLIAYVGFVVYRRVYE